MSDKDLTSPDPLRADIVQALRDEGLAFTPDIVAGLADYVELVLRHNRVMNLTGASSTETFVTPLLRRALRLTRVAQTTLGPGPATITDLGSGAGLSGIPLAILNPNWSLRLVERRTKRATFLRLATAQLRLTPRVRVLDTDLATLLAAPEAGNEHAVIAQALADTGTLLDWCLGLVRPTGYAILPRGKDGLVAPACVVFAQGTWIRRQRLPVDGLGEPGAIVVFQRAEQAPPDATPSAK